MQIHKRRTNGTTAAAIWFARRLFATCCCFALLTLPQLAHSFPFGVITAVNFIDFNGNTITVDSFDSADPNYSSWKTNWGYGTYNPSKRKDNGNIATDGQLISVGNADIYGHVATGPGGTTSIGSGGSVGSLAWVDGGNSGIQPGYSSDDMNVTFPVVTLPTNLGSPTVLPNSTSIINTSGYYQMNSLSGNLTISAPTPTHINVTLYLPNGFSYSGNRALTIETNCTLTIYTSGNISTSANGAINNVTQNARNLTIYGLPSCTSINLGGNAAFTGTIYAPEADFSFGGGGSSTFDFVGSVVAKSASIHGHSNFHFDESLMASTSTNPPGISLQPHDATVPVGQTAFFFVGVSNASPLSYQWTFNGTNIAGAINTFLTLTNVQLNQTGNYAVQVTNAFGSVISSNAMLTVVTVPPIISTQPTNKTVLETDTATFTVAATGSLPLRYQWSFNGTNIDWATNATLILTNVQFTDAGNYSAAVTNAFGATNSSTAILTVNPLVCVSPLINLVAWWRAENDANDIIGANNGNLTGGASFATGKVGQAFDFNGSNAFVSVPDSPALNPANAITVECWLYRRAAFGSADAVVKKGGMGLGQINGYSLEFSSSNIKFWVYNGAWQASAAFAVQNGQWYHVAGVYDGTNLLCYVNGQQVGTAVTTSGNIILSTNNLCIGNDPSNPSNRFLNGLVDEVSVYNRALSSNEIFSIYNARGAGKCVPSSPFIITQPTNQTATVGQTATFSVTADGTAPLSYQWSVNGTNIDDATDAALILNNVSMNQAGAYSVTITNAFGSVTSSNAILSVYASAAPMLNSALFSGGNQIQFNVVGIPGFNYAVQASANLVDWIPLQTNVSPFVFTETNANLFPQRFYRSVIVP